MKSAIAMLLLIISILTLSACHSGTPDVSESGADVPEISTEPSAESSQTDSVAEPSALQNPDIAWDEITADGVNEDLLIDNVDTAILEAIASEFQSLCEEIAAREEADQEYVLRGGWIQDIPVSPQYLAVVARGDTAMKPLYMIIYKSENQGLYEYICALALEELSGFDLVNDDGEKWATSKEFLSMFDQAVIKEKNIQK